MKTQTVQILTALSVAWTISVLTQSAVQMMTALPTECVLCVRTANVRSLNAVLMRTAIQQHLFAQTTSFAWRAAEAMKAVLVTTRFVMPPTVTAIIAMPPRLLKLDPATQVNNANVIHVTY